MSALSIFHARNSLPSERLLHLCIGASLVAHALLILFYKPGFEPPLPPTPIKLTLRAAPLLPLPEVRTPEAVPPPPTPAAAAKPPPPPVLKPLLENTPPKSAPAPAPVAEPKPVAAPPAAVPVITSVTAPVTAPVAAPVTAPAETKSAAPAAELKDTPRVPVVTTQLPVESSESQLIQAYAAQMVGIIGTQNLAPMPRQARENAWEGNAIYVMRIGADGNLADVSIAKSSGYELLDGAARTAAVRAKRYVPVPAGLRGKAFDIRGEIIFKIVEK